MTAVGTENKLTVIDDVMKYLGNGTRTKRWSDSFWKSLA